MSQHAVACDACWLCTGRRALPVCLSFPARGVVDSGSLLLTAANL